MDLKQFPSENSNVLMNAHGSTDHFFSDISKDAEIQQLYENISADSFSSTSQHYFWKRAFDIVFSATALICGIPLLLCIALLVKMTSHGPALYSSMRLGREGKLFKFWKFRTMYTEADLKLKQLLEENPLLRQEWQKYFKLKNDPRLTRLGKFLRKTSLDEFPQFWNVLIGDLSIVGPRPFLPREVLEIKRHIGEDIEKLFSVRPGLTGIWQTSGRSNLTFRQRVLLDVNYIDQRSFLFDLQLIGKTIPLLLFPKGAF